MTDLDQKGLEAAQAYISERMAGTGLAPLFATPIIRAYFSAIPSEQGRAEMTNLDPKALEVSKLTFFKEIGCENGGPLELKISILTLGFAFHEALRAYLAALPPSKGTDDEHA